MNTLRRWLIVLAGALTIVGISPAVAHAAVTNTLGNATVDSPNGTDFTWTCTVNPGGASIWITGTSWNDPSNPAYPQQFTGADGMPSTNNRTNVTGSSPIVLTFKRATTLENQSMGYRCIWYSSATTSTQLGKDPTAKYVTTTFDNDPPNAVLTQPDPVDEDANTTLTAIDSTDPDDGIATYDWDFGDGTSSQNHAWWFVDHVYADPGTYTVTVTVQDNGGLTDTDSKSIVVNDVNDPPEAGLTASLTTVVEGNAIIADASTSTDPQPGDVLSYTFDFGDGTTVGPQSGATASHTYTDEGTYNVSVTVSDGTLSDTAGPVAIVVKTTTMFGSNVDGSTGTETFAQALARQDAAYAPEVMRLFFSGLPSTSCTGNERNALARQRASIMSWKGSAATLLTGGYDSTLNAWFACMNRPTRVTYYHEPENPTKPFQTTAEKAEYRAASQYFYTLAHNHANAANLIVVQIFMDYTLDPTSGRNILDWYAGDAYVDELVFDLYSFKEEDTNATNDETMAMHQVRRPSLAFAQAHGKPYSIGELGYDVTTGRPEFLADAAEWARDNDVVAFCYFDSIGNLGDHRLLDTASQEIWAAAVAS